MMHLSIPLAVILTVAAPIQAPADDAKPSAVAPFLSEEASVVVHLNLKTLDARAFVSKVVGKLADEEMVNRTTKAVDDWAGALKAAGASDLFLLFDMADMPGMPVAVTPLTAESDGKAITDLLKGKGPNAAPPNIVPRWPACETFRGAVVAGSSAALARMRDKPPVARPELAAALNAGRDASVQIAINPSDVQRRAVEEAMPALPTELGGGPIATVTRGLRWASLTVDLAPKPLLRIVIQAQDADAATAIQKVVRGGLDLLAKQGRDDPSLTILTAAFGRLKPEVNGDRVLINADLEKTAALIAVPIQQAREAAKRSQCMNNFKQIGLAMHNYHATNNTFPPAFNTGKDGKALLSWRVLILPYLDQKALFDEFHLDEPWDSPHNKPLISRMPADYACPSGSGALTRDGKTTYLTPRGPATIFPGAKAISIRDITDGTSNTIFVVDASDDFAVT
ncbi:MAG: DUF1559 domain-containing protein, partial [Isosphaeraceae bacterium]